MKAPAGLAPAVLISLAVVGVGLTVYGQGFDLLSDGKWLLGVRTWLRTGALYPHLAVDAAPGTFAWVALPYALLGQTAAALAVTKALFTGLAAGTGWALARRAGAGTWAWAAPVGILALGPISPAVAALSLAAWAAGRPSGGRGWQLSVAAAALATFGVAATLAAILLSLLSPIPPRSRAMAAALAVASLVGSFVAAAGGDLPLAAAAIAEDGARMLAHASPGRSLLQPMNGSWSVPFSGVATGEVLAPLFAGHVWWRTIAAGLWMLVPAAVVGWAWARRRGRPSVETVALTLTFVGWVFSPAAREAAWVTTLWAWPAAVSALPRPRLGAGLGVVVALGTLGPDVLETGWLAAHAGRATLRVWERPSARVAMSSERIEHWESVFGALTPQGRPILVWPNRPGIPVLFDLELPTRQSTLLVGEKVDIPAVLDDLETTRPGAVILALGDALATTRLRENWPRLWEYLRAHYRVAGNVPGGGDPVRVLQRLDQDPGAADRLTLPERLADVEIPVSNEAGPAMRPGLTVGQTIVVGATDLRGFSVRWRTAGRPVETTARVRVWQRRGDQYDALLEFLDVDLVLPHDGYRSFLRFDPPIVDTAGKDLAITIELREDTVDELRLLWHRHDLPGQDVDMYPEGAAVVNRKPVPADLYFFSY